VNLLDQIPNISTCSLFISRGFSLINTVSSLTSVEAEKLAGVLPRFNVTSLRLQLHYCCAAAVNKLVSSITHKTLQNLSLRGISLTPAAAAALGRSLPEMSSLVKLELTGVDGSVLQVEEMEALFGGINKTCPVLEWLTVQNFNARGSLTSLTKRVHLFPNLHGLVLADLNMDECDLHGLLESLRSIPNLTELDLYGNRLGSRDRIKSAALQALPEVDLTYF